MILTVKKVFKNENIFAIMYKICDDEDGFLAKSIKLLDIMKANDEEVNKLNWLELMREIVYRWQTKKKTDKGEAAAQAAFKVWQESKGKGK